MANGLMGDTPLVVGGRSYTLRLDFNALCAMETLLDRPAQEVLDRIGSAKVRLTDIRALVWAALQRHHPDLTIADVSDLLSTDTVAVQEAIARAGEAAGMNDAGEAGAATGKRKASR